MFHSLKAAKLFAAQTIVYVFMSGAATVSAIDIIHLAEKYGVPAPVSWTAPLFIDGLAWLGKIGRSKDFLDSTRSAGLKMMAVGGALSLTANVLVGATLGLKIYGALVVTGFIVAEWYSDKLAAKTDEDEDEADAAPAAPAIAHAVKAAQRKAADAARTLAAKSPQMRPAELARATGVSAGTAARILKGVRATAPVSPGQPPITVPVLDAETVAELDSVRAYI